MTEDTSSPSQIMLSKIPKSFPVILVISFFSLYLFISKVNIQVINTESKPEEQKDAAKVQVGHLVLGGVKTWILAKMDQQIREELNTAWFALYKI